MDYASWQAFSGTVGLIIFVVLFAGVLTYALWPNNRTKFDRAAHIPLADDSDNRLPSIGGDSRG
jgi:cytochrome c oxidase cbb3-type subunit 4